MPNYQLDETDRKILSFLVNNARMPYLEIARECGISGAAVHQRIKKLEDNGVPVEFHLYKGMLHAFINRPYQKSFEAMDDIIAAVPKLG